MKNHFMLLTVTCTILFVNFCKEEQTPDKCETLVGATFSSNTKSEMG